MAVDISQRAAQIRTAVYGKDVRENLAGGLEDITKDLNDYESNLSANNDDFQATITKQQNNFEENLNTDNNNFKDSITKQQNDYESNVNGQWNNYKQNMDADESTRQSNENTRKSNETIRLANEDTRETVYNEFRDFVNTAQQINRVPYLFDGGSFDDPGTWVLSMDGGSF